MALALNNHKGWYAIKQRNQTKLNHPPQKRVGRIGHHNVYQMQNISVKVWSVFWHMVILWTETMHKLWLMIQQHPCCFMNNCVHIYVLIGLVGRVLANGPEDLGSIPGRVIPKTLKMILDTSLLNNQQYKVHVKGKVEQSRERSSAFPLHLSVVAIEKGALRLPLTTVANFTLLICALMHMCICVCVFMYMSVCGWVCLSNTSGYR